MGIQIIEAKAEQTFLIVFSNTQAGAKYSMLYCNFSWIQNPPKPLSLMPVFLDVLKEEDVVAYFFQDGDVILTWRGYKNHLFKNLTTTLTAILSSMAAPLLLERLFTFYEPYQDKEDLRALCRDKIARNDVEKNRTSHAFAAPRASNRAPVTIPEFSAEQKTALKEALEARARREQSEVLIVDDYPHTGDLLSTILSGEYHSRIAKNVKEALQLYSTYAADICVIDIYLPDGNGHALAQAIRANDPGSMIVMISGSNVMADVEHAKNNQIIGYIKKPFSKNRVLATVAACKKQKEAAQRAGASR